MRIRPSSSSSSSSYQQDEDNGFTIKKGPWTPEEDEKLIHYIHKHGHGSWRALPKLAGLQRCGKSCRLRWTNYLRPDIKRGKFSQEEEQTILHLHSFLGNKWSAIATHLPGRTDNEIKNFWNTHLKKKLIQMGFDPMTHRPRTDLFSSLPQLLALANLNDILMKMNTLQQQQQQPWDNHEQVVMKLKSELATASLLAKHQYLQNFLQAPSSSNNSLLNPNSCNPTTTDIEAFSTLLNSLKETPLPSQMPNSSALFPNESNSTMQKFSHLHDLVQAQNPNCSFQTSFSSIDDIQGSDFTMFNQGDQSVPSTTASTSPWINIVETSPTYVSNHGDSPSSITTDNGVQVTKPDSFWPDFLADDDSFFQ
ncbi:hypothetical protein MKW94_019957 [Papaver nudicaule]|uniref:Uncharacterized protein n=1 Tax=Papaver nudicaule TaxID=74823 RepID=A0AA41W311_PAPNU|nr:hypothetical protein [Papaver nudicaule]